MYLGMFHTPRRRLWCTGSTIARLTPLARAMSIPKHSRRNRDCRDRRVPIFILFLPSASRWVGLEWRSIRELQRNSDRQLMAREPRFRMFAESRRRKILGRSAKGYFAA